MIKIIIFGASQYGKNVLFSLDDSKYEVLLFIDNNIEIVGKSISRIKVGLPDEIIKYDFDYIIISVADFQIEMKEQLTALGVSDKKIITYIPHTEDIRWDELRVSMLRCCMEEVKSRNISGNMAELGVYRGDFAKYMNRYFPEKNLYLFDTFEGFDKKDDTNIDIRLKSQNSFTDTNVNMVLNNMRYPSKCIIKKGYFPDTAENLEDTFCLVSLDTDLYNPILNGLEYFYPRLQHGGYIFIHDYGSNLWNGVKKAVDEFCEKQYIFFVPILDRSGSVIITK